MYNEEIKMIYVTEKGHGDTKVETVLINAFKRAAPFEEKNGKELSLFSIKEIEDMMTGLSFKSDSSARAARTMYAGYTDWAIQHRRAMVNHYKDDRFGEHELSKLTQIQNNGIVTREEVMEWCRKITNPCDRTQVLMLFEGIKGGDYKEIINLRMGDLDEKNLTVFIRSRGKSIRVSKELMSYMIESHESTTYIPQTPTYRRTFDFVPSDLIIKEKEGAKSDSSERRKGRRVSDGIRRMLRNIGVSEDVTPATIYKSGIIQMISDGAASERTTPIEWTERHVEDIKDQFDFDVRNTGVTRFCNDYFKGSDDE